MSVKAQDGQSEALQKLRVGSTVKDPSEPKRPSIWTTIERKFLMERLEDYRASAGDRRVLAFTAIMSDFMKKFHPDIRDEERAAIRRVSLLHRRKRPGDHVRTHRA